MMLHYLDQPPSSDKPARSSSEEWNSRVDSFDVSQFANSVRESSADYIIFTLGQNTGHFCSPNAAYDDFTKRGAQSLLSKRDLVKEIAMALEGDVKVIAYLPSHAPSKDEHAVRSLKCMPPWDASAWGLHKFWSSKEDSDDSLSEFQGNWETIVACWGEAWGDLVAGWWIDGCYFSEKMYCASNEHNADSFSRALRKGNSNRCIAFNSGTDTPFLRICAGQDYASGEVSAMLPVHDALTPRASVVDGMQSHFLSFLGEWWGGDRFRFPKDMTLGYSKYLVDKGFAVTWDIPIGDMGELSSEFISHIRDIADDA